MSNNKNSSIIKIGYSNAPNRRIKELNAQGYGHSLGCGVWKIHTLYRSKSGLSARELETKAHRLLQKFKVSVHALSDNELFACTPDVAKAFLAQVPATKGKTNCNSSKYINEAIGEIKCSSSGDIYYYAGLKRFNYRTKELDELTEQEWIEAKLLYNSLR